MLEAGRSIEPALALFLGLRERLKRIAREVNSRDSGVGRSKPPPVSKGQNAFLWIHMMLFGARSLMNRLETASGISFCYSTIATVVM